MSQPATAGIVVGCIFIAIGAAFVGYKVYKRLWHIRNRRKIEDSLPPIREPFGVYAATTLRGGTLGLHGAPSAAGSTLASPYATLKKTSYEAVSSGDPNSQGINDGLIKPPFEFTRNNSITTSTSGTPLPSSSNSPKSPHSALAPLGNRSMDASEFGHMHSRSINGSTSSTMVLQRSYTPSLYKSSSALSSHASSLPPRRESYLPHNPMNRDSMMIVPPQPLGFGSANSMAMGTDQKTLAFSKMSGIGGRDDFGSAFTWVGPGAAGEEPLANDAAADGYHPPSHMSGLRRGPSSTAAAERGQHLKNGPSSMLGVTGTGSSNGSAGVSRTSSPGAPSHRSMQYQQQASLPGRADSRNSHRTYSSAGGGDVHASGLRSSQMPQYSPSAAIFKGLHQFTPAHGSVTMSSSDSTGAYSQSSLPQSSGADHSAVGMDDSPIMSPFRMTGTSTGPALAYTYSQQQRAQRLQGGGGSGGTAMDSLSASTSGFGCSTDAGGSTPSTGPTTPYTESSGRPSRSSGSMRSDEFKAVAATAGRGAGSDGSAKDGSRDKAVAGLEQGGAQRAT
ncbi:hypothetical protein K437DRAFT_21548 [Tilletiaria anomala UBC 951]|uniref:Uncharacterized protein n=1 Tax=Tilletiaria anomala (strain ATCC 24038 / CBS 436.72 / UBC 951) TaxID=1037660 RepID=A0A066VJ57_TILAU|nr:uncharacterized protein K437DRAFT_21548 [Tilletiaria anomala UBC 951]KDN38635.1 hypothetical protein K437DRAFT_21548 [Tilletiaria anomala UBC 951]